MADKAKDKSLLGRFGGRSRASKEDVPVAPLAPPSEPPALQDADGDASRTSSMTSSASGEPASGDEPPSPANQADQAKWVQALAAAEEQLTKAARRIEEVDELRRQSMPPPPTEANELRTRVAKVQVELSELRADRDEYKRKAESAQADLDSARAQAAALSAALVARDVRVGLLEASVHASHDKARGELSIKAEELDALAQQLALARGELRSSADTGSGLRGDLDAQLASLRQEVRDQQTTEAKLRGEVELERSQARAREAQLISEVREREARMVAEVQSREARLVELAQAREKQLLADADAALQSLGREKKALADRAALLQKALESNREREATLDAEARLKNSAVADDVGEREAQLEEQLENARRDARLARDGLDELREARNRSETRVSELQATVDSLGLERAALRAEAGQVRAQLELTAAIERRAHQLVQELEELRGENDFLNQEVARYASADSGKAAPAPRPQKE